MWNETIRLRLVRRQNRQYLKLQKELSTYDGMELYLCAFYWQHLVNKMDVRVDPKMNDWLLHHKMDYYPRYAGFIEQGRIDILESIHKHDDNWLRGLIIRHHSLCCTLVMSYLLKKYAVSEV